MDRYAYTVDSMKLEYGHRRICDGVPSFLGLGVGGRSNSNFLASTGLTGASIGPY